MCYRISLNKMSKDVKSPHMMSKPTWQRNRRQLYALGTLRLQPGACLYNTAPGAGTAARGRKTPGPRPLPSRSGPSRRTRLPGAPQPRPGRAPSPGQSGGRSTRARLASLPRARQRARAYLLRLLPQRDAHGPEARLELGNIHPPVLVEVQLSEEVGVAGLAIPVPVAGGRRQKEASQELEHVGAVRRVQTDSVPRLPPAGRGRDTARDAASARSCQGRGEQARAGPSPPGGEGRREGGSGGARSARAARPPSAPPLGGKCALRERGRPAAPRAPHSAPARSYALVPAQSEKHLKRRKRPGLKYWVWILRLIPVPL